MSVINYKTRGVCSREIIIDVEDNIIKDVKFIGGCHGNTQGISTLVKAIRRLRGICCGRKSTSCPDQLAKALKENV